LLIGVTAEGSDDRRLPAVPAPVRCVLWVTLMHGVVETPW
jgi:hypothetical protein